ncbi:MAG: beta-N-acetylhexosaminidase [Acidobacteria bacterium]|nr:MAG: beta-N-acetylhexosaminidase [Acidobacteriota bacterium]
MRTLTILVTAVFFLLSTASAGSQPQFMFVPVPTTVELGTGSLPITRSFSLAITGFHDGRTDRGAQRFLVQLSRQTGMFLKPTASEPSKVTLLIHADHDSEPVQKVGEDESYDLTIGESLAKLHAANPLGILHGLQTFLQLVEITPSGFRVPSVTIKDQPRFAWRGLLIDVARHFIPLDVLKRNLDGMEAVKMNVLHLHLTDHEGFRVESKSYPKLHQVGSAGAYYTQAELRDLIAYARDRGIRLLPEFEMPGHSRAWFVAYPELASLPGPYSFQPGSGPDPVMDPTQDKTYKVLNKFLGEMSKLFPDAYVHIGGDEVSGEGWDKNPKIQEFIHSHGMKNNQDLQAYFNQRLQKIVNKHHKIMIGWDEVLHPDLPKNVVVESWRGQQSLAAAAKQGYSGLLSFGYYLDLMWPAARHYAVDPMADAAATLSPEEKNRIWGGEACMWGEWTTPENIDSRIWPRTAAIAERLWSPQEVRDVNSMYTRLDELSWRLEWLGLAHRAGKIHMLRRMAGVNDISALRTLADVVEPVKDYARMENLKGPWDNTAPLNRLVDAASPESDTARHFADLVQRYVQSGFRDPDAESAMRALLTAWQGNDDKLHPYLEHSFLLSELAPLSQNLSTVAAAGLKALGYLDKGEPSPESWRTQQLADIGRAKASVADLLLMVVAPVQRLVEASSLKSASASR